jgi:DNA-binding NarL/FixJ family response regulator
MQKIIKTVIVDDNTFLIKAIQEKLSFFDDIQIKFTALDGSNLLTKISNNHNIDVILMDIDMPVLNGIEATEIIKKKYPHIKVSMLTVFDNDEVEPKTLYEGIVETLNGGAAMNPSIALKTLKLLRNPIDLDNKKEEEIIKLSTREIDVLEQLSKGLNYINIAENLILSPATVRKHIENIYTKLQVHNKLEAVQKAKKNNLI